jgi:hypothetical protein
MVHFYHTGATDAGLEEIAIEQLTAWMALKELIQTQWREAFEREELNLISLNTKFAKHRHYYRAGWERVREQVAAMQAAGKRIGDCYNCEFEAEHIHCRPSGIYESVCLVCNNYREWLMAPCSKCGQPLEIGGDSVFCDGCCDLFTARQLAAKLDDDEAAEHPTRIDPGNCAECEGYHTVIAWQGGYVCLRCLEEFDRLEKCEQCEEFSTADMGDSIVKGCPTCAGGGRQKGA